MVEGKHVHSARTNVAKPELRRTVISLQQQSGGLVGSDREGKEGRTAD